jgi:NAD-dependent deacetylase
MNTMEADIHRAARLMLASKYAVCLTGAGISVESGVRPFRGPDGLWTEYGEPPMDGYQRFLADPEGEWRHLVNKDGYVGKLREALEAARPHAAHYALAELEEMGILKHLITQNIDNLHRAAGSQKVAEIHGNFRKVRCIRCGSRYDLEAVSLDTLPPRCPACGGIVKTDTVLFGEPIPSDVMKTCQRETDSCDCMLSVGTSAFIYPAARLPLEVKRKGGTLIEIDPRETELSRLCDLSLRGKAGELLPRLLSAIKSEMEAEAE